MTDEQHPFSRRSLLGPQEYAYQRAREREEHQRQLWAFSAAIRNLGSR